MRDCENDHVCRYCSGNHPSNINCGSVRCCPTCKKGDHHAGTKKCRVFLERSKALAAARRSGANFFYDVLKAGNLKESQSNAPSSSIAFQQYGHSAIESEILALKRKIEALSKSSEDGVLITRIAALEEEKTTMKNTLATLEELPTQIESIENEFTTFKKRIEQIPTKDELNTMLEQKNTELLLAIRSPPPLQRGNSSGNFNQSSTPSQGTISDATLGQSVKSKHVSTYNCRQRAKESKKKKNK